MDIYIFCADERATNKKETTLKHYYGSLTIERFPLSRVARLINIQGLPLEEDVGMELKVESAGFSCMAALLASLSFSRCASAKLGQRVVALADGSKMSIASAVASRCLSELDRVWRYSSTPEELDAPFRAFADAVKASSSVPLQSVFEALDDMSIHWRDPAKKKSVVKDLQRSTTPKNLKPEKVVTLGSISRVQFVLDSKGCVLFFWFVSCF